MKAEVNAELHIFSKGSHGFGMGQGRGESTSLWPTSFVAWLHDCGMVDHYDSLFTNNVLQVLVRPGKPSVFSPAWSDDCAAIGGDALGDK